MSEKAPSQNQTKRRRLIVDASLICLNLSAPRIATLSEFFFRATMVSCVLCARTATIFCVNDNASLCSGCDLNIHSANPVASRHVRTPLQLSSLEPSGDLGEHNSESSSIAGCQSCRYSQIVLSQVSSKSFRGSAASAGSVVSWLVPGASGTFD